MNFISMSICIEINSQYQNINLSCAIIIEIKDAAFDNISTIEILETYFYCKNKRCIIV